MGELGILSLKDWRDLVEVVDWHNDRLVWHPPNPSPTKPVHLLCVRVFSPFSLSYASGHVQMMGASIVLIHEGGCLCGVVRYRTQGEPIRVTVCHCRFCQRATGGAYMVEPIFRSEDVSVRTVPLRSTPYSSEGSGKRLHIHSCSGCATKLYVTFERFPDTCGVYSGTHSTIRLVSISPPVRATSSSTAPVRIRSCRPVFPCFAPAVANDGTRATRCSSIRRALSVAQCKAGAEICLHTRWDLCRRLAFPTLTDTLPSELVLHDDPLITGRA